jgi:leucyl-tRNA synthetase
MEYVNTLYKIKAENSFKSQNWKEAILVLLKLVAPFAPHIADELWHDLGQEGSVTISDWPVHDEKYLMSDTVTIVVQVNVRYELS